MSDQFISLSQKRICDPILSGRYIGFLPSHFAQQWVEKDQMRPLLDETLGYQNPVYLTIRKTELKKPVLSAFFCELKKLYGNATQAAIMSRKQDKVLKVI